MDASSFGNAISKPKNADLRIQYSTAFFKLQLLPGGKQERFSSSLPGFNPAFTNGAEGRKEDEKFRKIILAFSKALWYDVQVLECRPL